MQEHNLFLIFTKKLDIIDVPYMVTGSVAGMFYGEPRLTHDVDIVLELAIDKIPEIEKCFPIQEFYFPPTEVVMIEATRHLRGHFNIIHHETGFKADIYLVNKDQLHHWAFAKRQKIAVNKDFIWIAPPEYVILRKLLYFKQGGSEKHIRDIQSMLKVSKNQIDLNELTKKIDEYNLQSEWTIVNT